MLHNLDLEKVLFLDIETVPEIYHYKELDKNKQELWDAKSAYFQKDGQTAEDVYERAGIYAEFGKIVCISVGIISQKGGERVLRLKSFCSDDEKVVLQEFCNLLNSYFNTSQHLLCGHNVKEFDLPFIARRILINRLKLPLLLDIAGKKPWEIGHLDTMELWKFGDFKHYTSLNLLASIFQIPTPKDDISGKDVARVYYEEQDLDRISIYCQKDVATVVSLLLKFKGETLISDENIIET